MPRALRAPAAVERRKRCLVRSHPGATGDRSSEDRLWDEGSPEGAPVRRDPRDAAGPGCAEDWNPRALLRAAGLHPYRPRAPRLSLGGPDRDRFGRARGGRSIPVTIGGGARARHEPGGSEGSGAAHARDQRGDRGGREAPPGSLVLAAPALEDPSARRYVVKPMSFAGVSKVLIFPNCSSYFLMFVSSAVSSERTVGGVITTRAKTLLFGFPGRIRAKSSTNSESEWLITTKFE